MKTIKGIYEEGRIRLLENVEFKTPQNILVTFLTEEVETDEEAVRQLSLSQPFAFLPTNLSDEREDLYQEYAPKTVK